MKEQAAKIAVDAAVKNPMFLESFSKILFSKLVGSEEESSHHGAGVGFDDGSMNTNNLSNSILQKDPEQGNYFSNLTGTPMNDNSIDCDEEEFEEIKTWHRKLRLAYLAISILMVITSLLSFVSLTVLTAGFLAFYVLIFSCLMCCHTASFQWFGIAKFIVQNFGFLYNPIGRLAFSMFLSVLVWDLGLFGKLSFLMLMGSCTAEIYVAIKHPQYSAYCEKLHYFDSVTPRRAVTYA